MNLNRNKKSITLDLKKSESKEIFKDLIKKVDVIIEILGLQQWNN